MIKIVILNSNFNVFYIVSVIVFEKNTQNYKIEIK